MCQRLRSGEKKKREKEKESVRCETEKSEKATV
jgi:hypothetical protein